MIRNRLKEHDITLSIAGALIVFLTFVVKDNLRDEWRATASAVDNAQNLLRLRKQIQQLASDQRDITTKVNDVARYAELAAHGQASTYGSAVQSYGYSLLDKERMYGDQEYITTEFEIVKQLANTLHLNSAIAKKIEETSTRIEYAKADFDQAERDSSKIPEQDKTPAPYMLFRADDRKTHGMSVTEEMSLASTKTDELEHAVLEEAERIKQTNERFAHWASWISGLLFTAGLLLSFLGKLSGKPQESPE